jgi:hypothetical protein
MTTTPRPRDRRPFREGTAAEALALDPGGAGLIARSIRTGQPLSMDMCFEVPPPVSHYLEDDGIAVLCVSGPLEHHTSWLWNSYEDILACAKEALAMFPRAFTLKIDSPGGVCAGLGETRKELRRMVDEAGIPFFAFANEMACSAAFDLASAADEIGVPEAGQLGSIGVILPLVDESKRLEKEGVSVRYVTSGARKADGHPGTPVTDEVVAVAQAKVDHLAQLFFGGVAISRDMSPKAVEALQAAVFSGFDAKRAGLADVVCGWPEFLGYIRSAIGATIVPVRATPSGLAAHTPEEGKRRTMAQKILQLTQAAAEAKATVAKAKATLAKAPSDRAAMKALETALVAKIAASAALSEAQAKMTTTKHIKHEEKVTEREEDDDDDADAAAPPPPAKDDDSDDEDDDSDSGADSSTGASAEYSADEKAIAAAFAAAGAEAGIYAPSRLLRLAQQVTGQKSIKSVFGALDSIGQRLAAAAKLEARVDKLSRESDAAKVTAMIDTALAAGKITKAQIPDLRAKGMQDRAFLKGFLAQLPKIYRTTAEGEAFEPRADADGNPVGGPSADQQKMESAATAGMSSEQVAKYRASVAEKLKTNGASRNPTH